MNKEKSITLELSVNCSTSDLGAPTTCRVTLTSKEVINILKAERNARENNFAWVEVCPTYKPVFEDEDGDEISADVNFRITSDSSGSEPSAEIYVFGSSNGGDYLDTDCVRLPARFANRPESAIDYLAKENPNWVWKSPDEMTEGPERGGMKG